MDKINYYIEKVRAFTTTNRKTSIFLFVVIMIVATKIDNAINPKAPVPTAALVTEAAAAPEKPEIPDPYHAVRPYLRANLNDWDSYDDEGYSEPEAIADHDGQPAYRVRHKYRAKNGFNATILNDQMFYYTKDGVYLVLDAR
jgi:hypothetical protein